MASIDDYILHGAEGGAEEGDQDRDRQYFYRTQDVHGIKGIICNGLRQLSFNDQTVTAVLHGQLSDSRLHVIGLLIYKTYIASR